ncbi:hypothetical protein SLA2020_294190 [Shorea laevis]
MPHRDLHRLANEHGPIMFLRLGMVPTIVVSSPQAAKLFLKNNDLVFASRPTLEAPKHVLRAKGLSFFSIWDLLARHAQDVHPRVAQQPQDQSFQVHEKGGTQNLD